MAHRMERVTGDLAATLFVLLMMGDERAVRATYVMGERTRAPAPRPGANGGRLVRPPGPGARRRPARRP
jgi:hypothetical protein